jgi:hypothetical protein
MAIETISNLQKSTMINGLLKNVASYAVNRAELRGTNDSDIITLTWNAVTAGATVYIDNDGSLTFTVVAGTYDTVRVFQSEDSSAYIDITLDESVVMPYQGTITIPNESLKISAIGARLGDTVKTHLLNSGFRGQTTDAVESSSLIATDESETSGALTTMTSVTTANLVSVNDDDLVYTVLEKNYDRVKLSFGSGPYTDEDHLIIDLASTINMPSDGEITIDAGDLTVTI